MIKKICTLMVISASTILSSVNSLAPFSSKETKAETVNEDVLSTIDGLEVRFDASTLDLEDGSKVSTLENLAPYTLEGNGDAAQDNSARQPTFVESSELNGKPAVRFSRNSYMQVGADTGFNLDDMTIFVVAKFDELYDHADIFSHLTNGSPWNHERFFNIEGSQLNYGWADAVKEGSYYQAKVSFDYESPVIISGRKSGEDADVGVNGTIESSFKGSTKTPDIEAPVSLGGSAENDSFTGDLGEILVFNRGLSDDEYQTVEAYLESKWGLEYLHENALSDLTINGETVKGFSPTTYSYPLLLEEDIKKESIAFETYYSDDTATVNEVGANHFEVVVGSGKNSRTYTIKGEKMQYDFNEIQRTTSNEVKLNDGFWSNMYEQYSTHTVNFMFDMFELSNSFDNFDRVAKGEKHILGNLSDHAGQVRRPDDATNVNNTTWTWIDEPWREGLIYEGIRAAAAFIYTNKDDSKLSGSAYQLQERVAKYIEQIFEASKKTTAKDGRGKPVDGYFSTYNILKYDYVCDETEAAGRWHHDLYNFGCLAEAATYWYRATGDTRLLFAATRFAEFIVDYIYGRDGFQGYMVVPPHELPEEAMENLYLLYKENPELVEYMEKKYSNLEGVSPSDRYYSLDIRFDKYNDIACSWITERGHTEGRYNNTSNGAYAQDNQDYREITEAQGHAVRANLWYNGMAYLANKEENFSFAEAAYSIWNNIVNSQMYITGGTGSTKNGDEAYGGTNQLPHDGYCETCASVGMAFYSQNMFNIFGDAKYADQVELEMYNGILGCLGLDGNSFYYTNPMISDNYVRPQFSNVTPCCVPMFLKYYSELPEIIYAKSEDTLFINQYVSSTFDSKVGNTKVQLIQYSDVPTGNVMKFESRSEGKYNLKVRMPSWSTKADIKVDGLTYTFNVGGDGYINFELASGKHEVEITFDRQVMRMYQDYEEENQGRVAFKYGPLVYCAERIDNKNFIDDDTITISKTEEVRVELDETTFVRKIDEETSYAIPTNILKVNGNKDGRVRELTLIPFYLRGNRDPQEQKMVVWIKEAE